jgi:hypothetical protein
VQSKKTRGQARIAWEEEILRRGGEEIGFVQSRLDRFHVPVPSRSLSPKHQTRRRGDKSLGSGIHGARHENQSGTPLGPLWGTFFHRNRPHLGYRRIQGHIPDCGPPMPFVGWTECPGTENVPGTDSAKTSPLWPPASHDFGRGGTGVLKKSGN